MEKLSTVSRFLRQATLGADQKLTDQVARQGITNWLERELSSGPGNANLYTDTTRRIWAYFRQQLVSRHGERALNGDGNNPALPYKWYFRMAWWQLNLSANENLLRHRIAQALGEILVISDSSALELDAVGFATYYDLLYRHAFGSYADLLHDVSMHPCMGAYLSHMNNRKADKARNIHPDENYAREIMQLFSIGLFELNADGSRKKDRKGRDIPTYDNTDIKQLARVFTGLRAAAYQFEWTNSFWDQSFNGYDVGFEDGINKTYKTIPFVDMTRPMKVDEAFHDRGPKRLLNGHIQLPGGQGAETEIRTVVDRLVAHPSTAPYIAQRLITQLVTSNPTPAYVRAVAQKFGKRGDLAATVREILTYPLRNTPEKVSIDGKRNRAAKLRSPVLRVTQLLRAFNVRNQSNRLWITGEDIAEVLKQHPMSSPTVFNFYKPDFTPHGPLLNAGMVAPEFEIHTSATSIGWVNFMYFWFFGGLFPAVSTDINADPATPNVLELDQDRLQSVARNRLKPDFQAEIAMAKDPAHHDELIDRVSLLLTGRTNLSIKPKIREAFRSYQTEAEWVVQTIAFMISISPEFTAQDI